MTNSQPDPAPSDAGDLVTAELVFPPATGPAPPPAKVLRKLFLTLFLRGRTARGLQLEKAPKSVASKLAVALFTYAMIGLIGVAFVRQPLFAMSLYLHVMTFMFLGMFVAAAAGEVLFNKQEAEILLHRPIEPGVLLWAKIRVLVEVSLWLAFALNLVGLVAGIFCPDSSWRFPLAHAVSIALEAIFCASLVVVTYQLCLRWMGRERLDSLMTAAQIVVSIAVVLGSQLVPRFMMTPNHTVRLSPENWWVVLIPPAWFAGIDDVLARSGNAALIDSRVGPVAQAPGWGSWVLAGLALAGTGLVVWLAFDKLAGDYQTGLQIINESTGSRPRKRNGRGWIETLADAPPLSWWLHSPVSRASFLLAAAYLLRDRDTKLRLYPGIAPMLAMPILMLLPNLGRGGTSDPFAENFSGFAIALVGIYLGLIPFMALTLLQYSEQFQASDIFRVAPLAGPRRVCDGARCAVLCLLTFPLLAAFTLVVMLLQSDRTQLALLLPGAIALPVYTILPNFRGGSVPLSLPVQQAKAFGRGLSMFGITMVSMAVSGLAFASWLTGFFVYFLLAEVVVAAVIYIAVRRTLVAASWPALD